MPPTTAKKLGNVLKKPAKKSTKILKKITIKKPTMYSEENNISRKEHSDEPDGNPFEEQAGRCKTCPPKVPILPNKAKRPATDPGVGFSPAVTTKDPQTALINKANMQRALLDAWPHFTESTTPPFTAC